jgi:hypothetical protein
MAEEEGAMVRPEEEVPTDLQQGRYSGEGTGLAILAEGPDIFTDLASEFTEDHFMDTAVITDLTSDFGLMYCHSGIILSSLVPISFIIPVDYFTGKMTMLIK